MTELEDRLKNSLEIAKAGYENAQSCIRVMDTKAGVAVGILMFFIPAPFAVVVWATKLENETAKTVWQACCQSSWLMFFGVSCLCVGVIFGVVAIWHGVLCLSPRVPKGHGRASNFNNECQPNVLFPMYEPFNTERTHNYFNALRDGVDLQFIVGEYNRQLREVGRIMHEKFRNMSSCFTALRRMLAAYSVGVVIGTAIFLKVWLSQH